MVTAIAPNFDGSCAAVIQYYKATKAAPRVQARAEVLETTGLLCASACES